MRPEQRWKPGAYRCAFCPRTFAAYRGRGIHEKRLHDPSQVPPAIVRERAIEYLQSHTVVQDDCWPFNGPAQLEHSYGRIPSGHESFIYAHRLALEVVLGRELRDGEFALHRCDNPPCVRPSHLFAGTQGDNIRDAIAKGRMRVGVRRVAA